jgi:hypothetical protein
VENTNNVIFLFDAWLSTYVPAYTKQLSCIISLHPENNTVRKILLESPFYREMETQERKATCPSPHPK